MYRLTKLFKNIATPGFKQTSMCQNVKIANLLDWNPFIQSLHLLMLQCCTLQKLTLTGGCVVLIFMFLYFHTRLHTLQDSESFKDDRGSEKGMALL